MKLNLIKKRLDSLFRYHCLPMIKQLSTKSNSNVLVSLQMSVNSWALTFVLLLEEIMGIRTKHGGGSGKRERSPLSVQ